MAGLNKKGSSRGRGGKGAGGRLQRPTKSSPPLQFTDKFIVGECPKGTRIDSFLTACFDGMKSRSFLAQLCDTGKVLVNSTPVPSKSHRVSPGDEILVDSTTVTFRDRPLAENISLDILFEDSDIIAVNKPAGMVVHPAPGSPSGTFVNALMHHMANTDTSAGISEFERMFLEDCSIQRPSTTPNDCTECCSDDNFVDNLVPETLGEDFSNESEAEEEEGEVDQHAGGRGRGRGEGDFLADVATSSLSSTLAHLRPGVVHRLDKGTSGVLVAGKNPESVGRLSEQFSRRSVCKTYVAVVVGCVGDTTISLPIGRCRANRQRMNVDSSGKPAVTHIRTLVSDGRLSVCVARIETGRTHQIRVHLKHLRCPVAGDAEYGHSEWNQQLLKQDQVNRQLLHAYAIKFQHPTSGQSTSLIAPLPLDMLKLISKVSASAKLQGSLILPSGHLNVDIDRLFLNPRE